jgi:hypothetical protein
MTIDSVTNSSSIAESIRGLHSARYRDALLAAAILAAYSAG